MRKLIITAFLLLPLFAVSAQSKYALVIGNSAYTSISKLQNPVNDAADMKTTLEGLGFTVDMVQNGSLGQMEDAVIRLRNRLSAAKNSYGFFFYAGHGVQSQGENYLIPVDADIKGENFLKSKALVVQLILDELKDAGNELNMIVLDACRDNPFGWARSGTRGLTVTGSPPQGSIIVYATSAGATAADGTGKNGLFTSQLLKNLKMPGLSVRDVFDKTGSDVMRESGNKQVPAIYSQFFETAYLGSAPASAPVVVEPAAPPANEVEILRKYAENSIIGGNPPLPANEVEFVPGSAVQQWE